MLYCKLSEIAEIQSGLVLSRKEAKFASERSVKYRNLNLRSINDDGGISEKSLDHFLAGQKIDEHFITRASDIIVRLFSPYRPAFITEALTGIVVPSQFAIVRLMQHDISSEFLCCYLSHRNVLEALAIRESGQASGGIKISALSEMKIPLLSMEKQRAVTAYSAANTKQKRLHLDLIQQYDLKMDAIMNRVIGGE